MEKFPNEVMFSGSNFKIVYLLQPVIWIVCCWKCVYTASHTQVVQTMFVVYVHRHQCVCLHTRSWCLCMCATVGEVQQAASGTKAAVMCVWPTKVEHCVWILETSILIHSPLLFLVLSLCSVAAFLLLCITLKLLACVPTPVVPQQDEYHMMHLVCSSRSPPASPMTRSRSSASSAASGSSVSSLTTLCPPVAC